MSAVYVSDSTRKSTIVTRNLMKINLKLTIPFLLSATFMFLLVACGGGTAVPNPTSEPSWQYIGFTHAPIDFQQTLVEAQECTRDTMLMPFFNYLNSNHAEGPKKWYIKACPGEPVKVYLPAKASLQEKSIRISGNAEVYNGDKILTDVQVYFEASADITLFFMHLALLDDVRSKVEASSTGVAVFEAGDHIGYVYAPSQGTYSLDFGVADKKVDAGLTENNEHW